MATELGLRTVAFEVDDLQAATDGLAADGYARSAASVSTSTAGAWPTGADRRGSSSPGRADRLTHRRRSRPDRAVVLRGHDENVRSAGTACLADWIALRDLPGFLCQQGRLSLGPRAHPTPAPACPERQDDEQHQGHDHPSG